MPNFRWCRCDGCRKPTISSYSYTYTYTSFNASQQRFRVNVLLCSECSAAVKAYGLHTPCRECGDYYISTTRLTPGGICTRCHDNFKNQGGIRSYGANVLNLLEEPLNEKQLLLGVELEIEASSDSSSKADRFLNLIGTDFAIAKEDGSVRGFEVVTLPAPLHTHAKKWEFLRNRQSLPKGLKGWSGTTNGMHIHISRDILPLSMLPKYRYFIHSQMNQQFVYNVAGRRSDTWANATYFPDLGRKKIDGPNRFIHQKLNYVKHDKASIISLGTGKYSAVNQHRSGKTFEFRIFRSTLNYDRIMTDLEFVDALTNYLLQVPLTQLSYYHWSEFVKWVEKSEYKKLKRFFGKNKHLGINYQTRDGSYTSGPTYDEEYDDRESVIHTTQDIYNCGSETCRVCNPARVSYAEEGDATICV